MDRAPCALLVDQVKAGSGRYAERSLAASRLDSDLLLLPRSDAILCCTIRDTTQEAPMCSSLAPKACHSKPWIPTQEAGSRR